MQYLRNISEMLPAIDCLENPVTIIWTQLRQLSKTKHRLVLVI